MSNAVKNNLVLSLSEVMEWLRLDPTIETSLAIPSEANAVAHRLVDVAGLRVNRWVTLAGEDAKITYIDFVESTIVVNKPVSINILTEGTPLSYFHQSSILVNIIESAKALADEYLNNEFLVATIINGVVIGYTVQIPAAVKAWVLSYVAMQYERPEAGLISSSTVETGRTQYDDEAVMLGLRPFRRIPL